VPAATSPILISVNVADPFSATLADVGAETVGDKICVPVTVVLVWADVGVAWTFPTLSVATL
jgi:hypothetical protein